MKRYIAIGTFSVLIGGLIGLEVPAISAAGHRAPTLASAARPGTPRAIVLPRNRCRVVRRQLRRVTVAINKIERLSDTKLQKTLIKLLFLQDQLETQLADCIGGASLAPAQSAGGQVSPGTAAGRRHAVPRISAKRSLRGGHRSGARVAQENSPQDRDRDRETGQDAERGQDREDRESRRD